MNDKDSDDVPVRKDGGYPPVIPPVIEITERLTRVEEKQDAQIEKLDIILDQLDGRLSSVSEKVETMLPRHNRIWVVYKGSKWLLGALIAGGATIEITGWF